MNTDQVEINKFSFCYFSTPEHLRTFSGRFIYIYRGSGQLKLLKNGIEFKSKKLNMKTEYKLISNVKLNNYSRIAKPIKLNFVSVEYMENNINKFVYFTPGNSWASPVWETNKLVQELYDLLSNKI